MSCANDMIMVYCNEDNATIFWKLGKEYKN